ncbi:LOW QUALITY PROTEIN: cysteinyl leukotriene receptor 2 [Phaethornis superciliosus]
MNISNIALNNNFTNRSFNCRIDSFKKVIYPIMCLFFFFEATAGNGLSIYVFCQPSKRKSSVKIYMQNLAVSDLMFESTLPFWATYLLLRSHIFGDIICRIMIYTLYMNMYSSIYFLSVLKVVCFIAIVYPFKHWEIITKYARITYAAIWIFVLAASNPLLSKRITGYSNQAKCLDLHPSRRSKLLMTNSFFLVVGLILPFCIFIVCIFAIRALLKSRTQHKKAVCHKKALPTIIITLIVFLICFLPYHVLQTTHLMHGSCSQANLPVHKALVAALCLAATNSCLDPVLYCFTAENFKASIQRLYHR